MPTVKKKKPSAKGSKGSKGSKSKPIKKESEQAWALPLVMPSVLLLPSRNASEHIPSWCAMEACTHTASPPPSVTATQRHRYPASSSPASTQERQLRLELERIKAEEAASAAEESCERSLKARYAEEERFSRVNRLKIDTQWRKLMRLVKVEELRKQVEIISQLSLIHI